jgi:predicted esterase
VKDNAVGVEDEDAGADLRPDDLPEVLTPTKLPSIEGQCPNISGPGTYIFSGGSRRLMVDIYMRADARSLPAPGGPLILYFHSLGSAANEVTRALGQPAIDAVVAQGGVVASFTASTCLRCGLADDVVWYDEDDAVSDQVVACVTQTAQVDLRRIHAVGFSAGALHSMHLALARSNYIASVVSYSGGVPAGSLEPQDPANKVPALLSYGREGVDNALVDFNIASRGWYETFSPRGYYTLLCDHQRGHEIPTELSPDILKFLLDHPYQVAPEPYALSIPNVFPTYCRSTPP